MPRPVPELHGAFSLSPIDVVDCRMDSAVDDRALKGQLVLPGFFDERDFALSQALVIVLGVPKIYNKKGEVYFIPKRLRQFAVSFIRFAAKMLQGD